MYKYELINNHYVVEIDGRKFLIDTGAPSFRINNDVREIIIDGKSYPLGMRPMQMDEEAIKKTIDLVGVPVDGFIGLDLIARTSLTVYKNGQLEFKTREVEGAKAIPLKPGMGLMIKISSHGIDGDMVLDTGAKYGYLDERLIQGLEPYEKNVYDFNPHLRDMHSDMYHVEIEVGGMKKVIDAGYNKGTLGFPIGRGIILIGNITTLFDEVCVIDAERNRLFIK